MLTVQNLSKKFGKKQVLDDISFNAKKGEVTALIGVNGIGKTTIMNSIAGLLPYDKGQIVIDDMPVRKVFAEKPAEFDPRKYLGPARDNMEKLYKHKIVNVLGSENKLAQLD